MELLGYFVSDWIVYFSIFCFGLYLFMTWRFNELKELGIPHPKPWPIIGSFGLLQKFGFRNLDIELMKKYGKVCGYYEGRSPNIIIGDVDIVKQVMVKDFNNFVNRRRTYLDGLFGHSVFNARGGHWKNMRSQLTPAFSSGKMRPMVHLMNTCTNTLVKHIENTKDGIFEAKEYGQAFTMDVIATTAFGLQLDTQDDPKNPFIQMAMRFFDTSLLNLQIILPFYFPYLCPILEKLGVEVADSGVREANNFFKKTLTQAIEERKKSKGHIDFLKLMIDAEKQDIDADQEVKEDMEQLKSVHGDTGKGLTFDEIIGNSLLFFLAGYETTATTISLMLHQLAMNPDVQQKMRDEINEVLGDKVEGNYESVQKMTYMEQTINESLRLACPVIFVEREALEEVIYKGIRIPKGQLVRIPILALHLDPEVYPDPEKFDPERFSAEEKAKRDPFYFMPFGGGPRTCIGMRLALLEIKLAMVKLLKKFKFVKCEKTVPIRVDKASFIMKALDGLWVKAESI